MTEGSRRPLRPGGQQSVQASLELGGWREGGSGEDQPGSTEQEAEREHVRPPQPGGRPLRTARGQGDG